MENLKTGLSFNRYTVVRVTENHGKYELTVRVDNNGKCNNIVLHFDEEDVTRY